MTRTIAIIAAVAANGAIGFKGGIPGGVLVCGNTTAGTLSKAVLTSPMGRELVAIHDGHIWTADPAVPPTISVRRGPYSIEAVAAAYPDRNVWICGGSRLYAEAMRNPLVTEMHLSFMDCEPEADAFFPEIHCEGRFWMTGHSKWTVVSEAEIKQQNGCHRVYRRI